MKKVLTIILAGTLLTSCSIKNEANDLWTRITSFIMGENEIMSEVEKDSPQINFPESSYVADSSNSNGSINIESNDDQTVRVNVSDGNQNVIDVNIDQETYEEYDYLIESAKDYIANNDVDINRLMNDKGYMMKHGFSFARKYDIDINSLSAGDIAKLQGILQGN